VRMVAEIRRSYGSQWSAICAVAGKLGIGAPETVRTWVRRAEGDGGHRPGVSTEQAAEVARLKRENAELRRANEILKAAAISSGPSSTGARDGDRFHHRAQGPPRGRWAALGCRALVHRAHRSRHPDRPSTYYEWAAKQPSRQQLRDEHVTELIRAEREHPKTGKFTSTLGSRKM